MNMGKPPAYDPVSEIEYLVTASLKDAEADGVLRFLASTFDPSRDRVVPGLGASGPRILDFAPLLVWEQFSLNEAIKALLKAADEALGAKVEIEFAMTIEQSRISRRDAAAWDFFRSVRWLCRTECGGQRRGPFRAARDPCIRHGDGQRHHRRHP